MKAMNNILVTTDFSFAASNAIEYAAKFAQKTNRNLTIANFKISEPASEPTVCRYIRETPDILKEMSETIHKTYSIQCDYIVKRTNKSLEKTMETISSDLDLIVMGTNGADDLYQYFLGSNAYHVVKRSKCPVLVVPENVSFESIERIVFAWDYTVDSKIALSKLNELLKTNQAEITLLHISRHITPVSDELFEALKETVSTQLTDNKNIRFDKIFSKDPGNFSKKLLDYTEDLKANLLVTMYHERGIQNIFHGAITRKLSETLNCPLLVLPI